MFVSVSVYNVFSPEFLAIVPGCNAGYSQVTFYSLSSKKKKSAFYCVRVLSDRMSGKLTRKYPVTEKPKHIDFLLLRAGIFITVCGKSIESDSCTGER